MKPLLTIAVPTYNRSDELNQLVRTFLMPAANMEGVEVIVCDNSDEYHAKKNRRMFEMSAVNYRKNESNLGFHGNLLQCIVQSNGEWLWILSDDDDVQIDEFAKFLSWLRGVRDMHVGVIMLPYVNSGKIENTREYWNVGGVETLRTVIEKGRWLPFVLFSSAVVRKPTNIEPLRELYRLYKANDYLQVVLFSKMIADSQVSFWDGPYFLTYNNSGTIRFDVPNLIRSIEEVLRFIESEMKISKQCIHDIKFGFLQWWVSIYIRNKIGVVDAENAKESRRLIYRGLFEVRSLRLGFIFSFATVMPTIILKSLFNLEKMLRA